MLIDCAPVRHDIRRFEDAPYYHCVSVTSLWHQSNQWQHSWQSLSFDFFYSVAGLLGFVVWLHFTCIHWGVTQARISWIFFLRFLFGKELPDVAINGFTFTSGWTWNIKWKHKILIFFLQVRRTSRKKRETTFLLNCYVRKGQPKHMDWVSSNWIYLFGLLPSSYLKWRNK